MATLIKAICLVSCAFMVHSVLEYLTHRYVLHGLARWVRVLRYHMRHHADVYRAGFRAHGSELGMEVLGIFVLISLSILMIWPWSPTLALLVVYFQLIYFCVHAYAHRHPEWCTLYLPWHYRHHVDDPQRDYSALSPMMDRILGTEGAAEPTAARRPGRPKKAS